MSPSIVYVVLTSGKELIAEVVDDDGVQVTLSDPLTMESTIDEDDPTRRLVFMSRFSPYAASPRVVVSRGAIAIMSAASPLVTQYYQASLRYCARFTDVKFDEGIEETIGQIDEMLEPADSSAKSATPDDKVREAAAEVFEAMWAHLSSVPSGNTVHNVAIALLNTAAIGGLLYWGSSIFGSIASTSVFT